jgi:hypothetical protein
MPAAMKLTTREKLAWLCDHHIDWEKAVERA